MVLHQQKEAEEDEDDYKQHQQDAENARGSPSCLLPSPFSVLSVHARSSTPATETSYAIPPTFSFVSGFARTDSFFRCEIGLSGASSWFQSGLWDTFPALAASFFGRLSYFERSGM
mgnify:CR=1 FL=1